MGLFESRLLTFGNAVFDNNVDVVRQKLADGYDPRQHPRHEKLLVLATSLGHTEIVDILISSGFFDINDRSYFDPLLSAVLSGHQNTANFFIEKGAIVSDEVTKQALRHGVDLIEVIWDVEAPIDRRINNLPPELLPKVFWFIWGREWRTIHARIKRQKVLGAEAARLAKIVKKVADAKAELASLVDEVRSYASASAVVSLAAVAVVEGETALESVQIALQQADASAESLAATLSELSVAKEALSCKLAHLQAQSVAAEKGRSAILTAVESLAKDVRDIEQRAVLGRLGVDSLLGPALVMLQELEGWKRESLEHWSADWVVEKRKLLGDARKLVSTAESALDSAIVEANNEFDKLLAQANSFMKDLQNLRNLSSVEEPATEALNSLQSAVDHALNSLENESDSLPSIIAELTSSNTATTQAIQSLKSVVRNVENDVTALLKEANSLTEELTSIEAKAALFGEDTVAYVAEVASAVADVSMWRELPLESWNQESLQQRRHFLSDARDRVTTASFVVASAAFDAKEAAARATAEVATRMEIAKEVAESVELLEVSIKALMALSDSCVANGAAAAADSAVTSLEAAQLALREGTSESLVLALSDIISAQKVADASLLTLKAEAQSADMERVAILSQVSEFRLRLQGLEIAAAKEGLRAVETLSAAKAALQDLQLWEGEDKPLWTKEVRKQKQETLAEFSSTLSVAGASIDDLVIGMREKAKAAASEAEERAAILKEADELVTALGSIRSKALSSAESIFSLSPSLQAVEAAIDSLKEWNGLEMQQWSAPLVIEKRREVEEARKLLSVALSDVESLSAIKTSAAAASGAGGVPAGKNDEPETGQLVALDLEIDSYIRYGSVSEAQTLADRERVRAREQLEHALVPSYLAHQRIFGVPVNYVMALDQRQRINPVLEASSLVFTLSVMMFGPVALVFVLYKELRRAVNAKGNARRLLTAEWDNVDAEFGAPFREHLKALYKAAESGVQSNDFLPIMLAAARGDVEAVRIAILNGADMNSSTKLRLTVVMVASAKGHVSIVELLCSMGVDVSVSAFDGSTALSLAVEKEDNFEIVNMLLKYEASPHTVLRNGMTLLMLAAKTGDLQSCKKFVEKEEKYCVSIPSCDVRTWCKLDRNNLRKETALLIACKYGHDSIVETLMRGRSGVPDVMLVMSWVLHHSIIWPVMVGSRALLPNCWFGNML